MDQSREKLLDTSRFKTSNETFPTPEQLNEPVMRSTWGIHSFGPISRN